MGGLGRRASMKMLEAAFDAGIRHFDVAPLYGFGEAEACLGDFMARHKGQLTITTKFGIPPPAGGTFARLARAMARPVAQRTSALRSRLTPASSSAGRASFPPLRKAPPTSKPPNPIFCVEEARKSLYNSLAALKVDHIDVWLLHEVTANDLNDDTLIRFLEKTVEDGLIGTYGAGSDRGHIDALVQLDGARWPTLQYEWSVFESLPPQTGAFRIHHRSLTGNFRSLHGALLERRDKCAQWSQMVGADLADADILAKLMLKAALLLNPESVILFSSKRADHIEENAGLADDDSLSAQALSLYRVVQAELNP